MSSSRPTGLTPKQFGATNAVVTLAAMSFLVWVIYFHEGSGSASRAASLPLINAILNGTSAVLISVGLWAIKQRKRTLHMQLMIGCVCVVGAVSGQLHLLPFFARGYALRGPRRRPTDLLHGTHQPRAAFRGDVPDDSDVILPRTEQPSRNPSPPIQVDVGGVDVRVGHRSRGLFHTPRDPLVNRAGRLHGHALDPALSVRSGSVC
jgi:hypothetical protein